MVAKGEENRGKVKLSTQPEAKRKQKEDTKNKKSIKMGKHVLKAEC